MKVSIEELRASVESALERFGYPPHEVDAISEVLMYAQMRGNNQGVVKLAGAGLPKDPQAGEIRVVRETRLSALLDGSRNAGIVVLLDAAERAVAKAGDMGIGIVGTFNTNTSTGAAGFYARRIADAGHVGLVFCGSPPTVSVYGSFEPLLGTNPLAVGVPSNSDPIVFDMATSAISWYGLVEAESAGRLIPEDVAYDRDGHLTTDPKRAMRGAIKPFDGSPKGSGLSMVVEALTGPLVGAAFAGVGDDANNWGNLVVAIDPDVLVPRQEFRQGVTELVDRVKRAKRLPGVTDVFLPGERGDSLTEELLAKGEIEIDENLMRDLERAASG